MNKILSLVKHAETKLKYLVNLPMFKINPKFEFRISKQIQIIKNIVGKVLDFVFRKLDIVSYFVFRISNLKIVKQTRRFVPAKRIFAIAVLLNFIAYTLLPLGNEAIKYVSQNELFQTIAQYDAIETFESDKYLWRATNEDLSAYFGDKKMGDFHRFAIEKSGSKFDLRSIQQDGQCPQNPEGCSSPPATSSHTGPIVDVYSLNATTPKLQELKQQLEDIRQKNVLGAKTAENVLGKASLTKGDPDKTEFIESKLKAGRFSDTQISYEIINRGVRQTVLVPTLEDPSHKEFLLTLDGFTVIKTQENSYTLVNAEQTAVIQIGKPSVRDSAGYETQASINVSQDPRGVILSLDIDPNWFNSLERRFPVVIENSFIIGSSKDPYIRNATRLLDSASETSLSPLKIGTATLDGYLFEHYDSNFQVLLGAKDTGKSKVAINDDEVGIETVLINESSSAKVAKETKLTQEADTLKDIQVLVPDSQGVLDSIDTDNSFSLVDSIRASDIQPGIDVINKVYPMGVKEDIVIKNQDSADALLGTSKTGDLTFEYALNVYNLTPRLNSETNEWEFFQSATRATSDTQDSSPKFRIPSPFAEDAASIRTDVEMDITPWGECGRYLKSSDRQITENLQPGNPTFDNPVSETACYKITLQVDSSWLQDQNRLYPVIVDPSIVDDTSAEFAITNDSTTSSAMNRVKDTGSGASPVLETFYQDLAFDNTTRAIWHMNENAANTCSGGANDVCHYAGSGSGYDLAFSGNTAFTTSSRLGASAVAFDGADDDMSCTDANCGGYDKLDPPPTGGWSLAAWVYVDTVPATDAVYIGKSNGYWLAHHFDDAGCTASKFSFAIRVSAAWTCANASIGAVAGNWYHLAGVYDGVRMYIYVNGVLEGSTAKTGSIDNNTDSFYMGGVGTGYEHDGSIDEAGVWARALTSDEIRLMALRRPSATFTSNVFDLTGNVTTIDSLTWTENGVATGDGETLFSETSLIAQWKLNDGTASTNVTTAAKNAGSCSTTTCDLTLTNFTAAASTDWDDVAASGWTKDNARWPTGAGLAEALMFDGSNDYATCTDANCGGTSKLDYPGSGGWTVSAWVKPQISGQDYIITKASSYNLNVGSTAAGCTSGYFGFTTFNGSVWSCVIGTNPINTGEWYFVVGTFDGTNGKLYVNGVLERTTAINVPQNSASDFYLGSPSANETLNGVIDSVAIYSRELSLNEIISNYNHSNIEFQTRTGTTTTPADGTWEAWKPTTGEAELGTTGDMDGPYQYNTTDSGLVSYWPMDETTAQPYDVAKDVVATNSYASFATDTIGILEHSMVSYWKLDEDTAITAEDYIHSFDGVATGTTVSTSGKLDDARVFNGTSDKLTTSSMSISGNVTTAAWVYPTSCNTNYNGIIHIGGTGMHVTTAVGGGTTCALTWHDPGVVQVHQTTGTIALNQWTHIAVVQHGTTMTTTTSILYVNGSAVGSTLSGSGSTNFTGSTYLGVNNDSSSFFTGRIDEAGIWNRALSSTEIGNLYNSNNANALTATTGNHGYPVNGPTIVDGKFGKARGFDGTDDQVNIGTPLSASAGTIEYWMYPASTAVSNRVMSDEGGYWYQEFSAANTFRFTINDGGAKSTPTTTVTVGKWYHVAATWGDSSNIRLYVNGALVGSTAAGSIANVTNAVKFGGIISACGGGCDYTGVIDEVRLYNTAQTAATIQEHYLEGTNQITGNNIANSTDTSLKVEGTGSQKTVLGAPKVDSHTAGLWRLDETNSSGPLYDAIGYRSFATDTNGSLEQDLVAYWKLDDSGATAVDSVSRLDADTITGTAVAASGKLGNGKTFDGDGDVLRETDTGLIDVGATTDSYTVSAWFKTSAGTTQAIIAKNDGSGNIYPFEVYVNTSGNVNFSIFDNTNNPGVTSDAAYDDGAWHHMVAVRNVAADQLQLYIDTTLKTVTDTTTATTVNNDNLSIGNSSVGYALNDFNGTLDEIGLWRRALSSTEVSDLYNSNNANSLNSKASNNGAIVSGATVGNEGFYNKAARFATDGDRIETAPVSYGYSDFSVEAWVYPTGSGATWNFIVSQCDSGTHLWNLSYSTARVIHFNSGVGGTPSMNGIGAIPLNEWSHVAATRVSSTGVTTLYINGLQDDQETLTAGAMSSASRSVIMGWFCASANQNLIGKIDEVRISNTTRSAEEIWESYRAGANHRMGKAIASTDLSGKSSLPFYIAADRPGTYLEATVGESAYANYEPDANTVGLWHLEERRVSADAGIRDYSGYDNHAATTAGATFVSGKIGNARYFDGSGDYIDFGSPSEFNFGSGNFTYEAWIKTSASGINAKIIAQDVNAANHRGLLVLGASNVARFSCRDASSNMLEASTVVAVNDGQWHHVVGVRSGTNAYIYLDGVLSGTGTNASTGSCDGGTATRVGDRTNGDQPFNGLIDEVRISNIARSADEIRQAFEISKRTHPITIDFASELQAAYTSGTSITINNSSGQTNMSDALKPGDTLIVQENVGGTEYRSTATVSKIANTSRVYGTVTLAAAFSSTTMPPGGYTTAARAFKWQREYFPLQGITLRGTHDNAVTRLTLRVTDSSLGANIWLDDFKSNSSYLTNSSGSTPDSTAQRYYQYRAIFTNADPAVSANLTAATQNYTVGPTNEQTLRHGKWWNSSGVIQPFWWAR